METQAEQQSVATWSLVTVGGRAVAIARSGTGWSVVAGGAEAACEALDDALRRALA